MAIQCASCQAENRDDAKFCDKCGAALTVAASPEITGEEKSRMNWGAILIVLVIVAGLGWVLFGPSGGENPAQPGQVTNPHAGVDMGGGAVDGANPHGDGGDEAMGQMMAQVDQLKSQVEADPLNVEALSQLYNTYGMVGMTDRIKPYLDAAVDALIAAHGEMEPADFFNSLNGVAYATYFGGVPEEGLTALDKVRQAVPEYKETTLIRGNVLFDSQRNAEAVASYTEYLDSTTPDEAGLRYWEAKTDRATLYLTEGTSGGDTAKLDQALAELTAVSQGNPLFWNAWFNLGVAQSAKGDNAAAEIAFGRALEVSDSEEERFRAETELAKLRGEELPAPPASMGGAAPNGGMTNPHGGMGETGGGMTNPHGGMGETGGGMTNPHGDGG